MTESDQVRAEWSIQAGRFTTRQEKVIALVTAVRNIPIPVNIVDLGLIYACRIERLSETERDRDLLTAPGYGMGDILVDDVASKVRLIPTIEEVSVALVFEPPWDYHMMSYEARLETGIYETLRHKGVNCWVAVGND